MSTMPVQVPPEITAKWQDIVDLLAQIVQVPSALVMKVDPPNIKVLVSSDSKGNPYTPNEVASLNTGLYCETVMRQASRCSSPMLGRTSSGNQIPMSSWA